jgi:hypothetical protein
MNSQASKAAAKAASKAAADNRSRASSQDKAASSQDKAASKGAADNRSRASSQDKAANRNLSKAVNRLSAEFGQYSDEMASGVDWSACHWRPSPTPRASRLERFAGGCGLVTNARGGAKPWGKQKRRRAVLIAESTTLKFRYLTGALLETNKRTIQHKRKRCVCNLLIGGATSP